MDERLCKTCQTPLQGKYCYKCGEKVIEHEKDYSLKHFTEEAFHGFFHFDNKIFNSFKLLFKKPGFLTKEYLEGRRVKYVNPIHLFLVLALVLAFLPASLSILSQPLAVLVKYPPFLVDETLPAKVIQKTKWDIDLLATNFKRDFDSLSKLFSVLYILILGLFFWIITWFKRKYFIENLIAAIHLFSFMLIVIFLFIIFLVLLDVVGFTNWAEWFDEDNIAMVLFLVFFGRYCYYMFIRVYEYSKWKSVLYSSVTFVFLLSSLMLLRTAFYHIILYRYLYFFG